MDKSRFLILLALVATVTAAIPFDLKLTPLLVTARYDFPRVSVTGNSVLEHTSKCDRDSRSLARMLGDDLHQPVTNLGFSGQMLSNSVNLAGLSLRNPRVQTVVLPISLFALSGWDTDPIRFYALFKLLNPALRAASLAERMQSPGRWDGMDDPLNAAFEYGGRAYPDYAGLKTIYFRHEEDVMRCPENDGDDRQFIAANYDHSLFELPLDPRAIGSIQDLGRVAQQRGKALLVVVLPMDYDFAAQLGLPADRLRQRVASLVERFGAADLDVLDLSATLRNGEFADRWCACGHLLETGRLAVAEAIAARLRRNTPELASHY